MTFFNLKSAEELRNLLAEFRQQNRDDIAATQDAIRQLTLAVISNLAAMSELYLVLLHPFCSKLFD